MKDKGKIDSGAKEAMGADEIFMKHVLRLAKRGLGLTSPNPLVGALLVKNDHIIGSGYHKKAGAPHAEIEALSKAGERAKGSALYVNLEPCNHYGRTPPCTKAILDCGVKRVVVGMADPNPGVSGGGCDFLRSQGVEVKCGALEEECTRLNEVYIKFVTKGKPFVILKAALTFDGWIATQKGNSKWITNEKSRRFVHTLRKRVDAIMVGVETIIADDPLLMPYLIKRSNRGPVRVIADTNLRIPVDSRVLNRGTSALTIIAAGSNVSSTKRKRVEGLGAKVVSCKVKEGRIDLPDLLDKLARMSVTSVLVEGGGTVFGSIIRQRLADKFYIFLAPKILGGDNGVPFTRGPGCDILEKCLTLRPLMVRRFDDDILIEAYPQR
jgi:diaminohydroxyphosphoribosylaminopyrimidine deaminase/5-amino-6-(5-phosphoribosylamino)uracil reductase